MPIKKKNLYHGAALMILAQDGRMTFRKSAKRPSGWYLINRTQPRSRFEGGAIYLYIKYLTGGDSAFNFTFTPDELEFFANHAVSEGEMNYVALVCGMKGICLLSVKDINELEIHPLTATVRVTIEPGYQMRASNPAYPRRKAKVIAHKDFPNRLLSD